MHRAVLITDANTRLGAHLARGLAKDGWHICIHYNHSDSEAEILAGDISRAGGSASIVKANVSADEDVKWLVENCRRDLHALINSPSTFRTERAQDFTTEMQSFHRALNLDALTRIAADFAEQAETGASIINMTDQPAVKSNALILGNSYATEGIDLATKSMARRFAPKVRVNSIDIGPMTENTPKARGKVDVKAQATSSGEGCTQEGILQSVRYLLSAKAVTGQMICLDGGQGSGRLRPDVAIGARYE